LSEAIFIPGVRAGILNFNIFSRLYDLDFYCAETLYWLQFPHKLAKQLQYWKFALTFYSAIFWHDGMSLEIFAA